MLTAMRRAFFLLMLVLPLAASLTGCSTGVYGVSVVNKTDQLVKAEFVQVNNFGEMTSSGFQTISPTGEFRHKIDDEERTRGQRVRFTVVGQSVTDGNWVMLSLPAARDRMYELRLVNGRLSAKEVSKATKLKVGD